MCFKFKEECLCFLSILWDLNTTENDLKTVSVDCHSKDIKSKSIESMKNKIDITEVRVEELTAELSRKTEEVQLFEVIQTNTKSLHLIV